ncbi:MAG: 50S ribosomal protein L30 [Nitrospirae bacterium]|nr:50S ribosomal protein L30 [Nitrospirota bacterium]
MIKITLKRSYAGLTESMRRTLRALGLKKIGMTVEKKTDPAIYGMIHKVSHLVSIEETGK